MDKFTVKRVYASPASFRAVQIRTSTYEQIKQMQDDTGASFVDLVEAMVAFCAERLNVIDGYSKEN